MQIDWNGSEDISGDAGDERPVSPVRRGWGEASREIAAASDDVLVMGEFGNDEDTRLTWQLSDALVRLGSVELHRCRKYPGDVRNPDRRV